MLLLLHILYYSFSSIRHLITNKKNGNVKKEIEGPQHNIILLDIVFLKKKKNSENTSKYDLTIQKSIVIQSYTLVEILF